MNREALLQLRRVLENLPPEKFDIRTFSNSCGTTCCAAGWAAVDKWFQGNTNILDLFRVTDLGKGKFLVESVDLPIHDRTFEKLAKLFGLTQIDADNLFGGGIRPDHSIEVASVEEVIGKIDLILAGMRAVSYVEEEGFDDYEEEDDD